MNTRISAGKAAVLLAIVCASAVLVWADELDLHEKLGESIKIQLKNVTIVEALERIGQKTGVKFALSDEAEWKLPHGKATRLSVTMDGVLANSVTEMLNAFFMRYAVGDGEVTIYPRPELDHILGRPTTKHLELLKTIYTKPIRVYFVNDAQKTINEALGQEILVTPIEMQQRLNKYLHLVQGKDNIVREKVTTLENGGKEVHREVVERETRALSTPITLAQLVDQGDFAWYVATMGLPGQVPEIRVVREHELVEAKLDQVVDISFKEQRAEAIIQRLVKRTGMELHVHKRDPSWLNEKISVNVQNTRLSQALQNVLSSVDGDSHVDVKHNRIEVVGPLHEKEPPPTKTTEAKAGDYVGKISIPMDGGAYYIEFMLREKDLTDELRKLWKKKMEQVLQTPTIYDLPEQESENK